jgi:hypothetical protein
MIRLGLLTLLVALAGCSSLPWAKKPEALLPEPIPQKGSADAFGDKQDRADQLVAASVAVAREANAQGKPPVVEAELAVAASLLPPPPQGDLSTAKLRAQSADPKAYELAKAEGAKLKKDLDELWQKMEAQQKKSEAQIISLQKQLDDKQLEVESARKDKIAQQLSTLGAGMIALGVLLLAFGHFVGVSKLSAGMVIIGGILTVSLTWVMDSPAFRWVAGGILALVGVAALQGMIALSIKLWSWVSKSKIQPDPEHDPAQDPQDPAQDPADTPPSI